MAQSDDKSEIVIKATLEKENAVQGLRELSKQLTDVAKLATGANFGHLFSIGGQRLDVVLPKLSKSVEKTANTVEKSIKKIDETVKQASPTLEFFGKIGTELMQGWTKRIAIFTSYRAIGAISGMFSDAVTSMVELEKEFANIQAITASSNSEMVKLKDTIYTVGTNTRFTVEELAQATVVLGQAGLSANQISSALESVAQLASATGTDLNTSVNVLTSSLSVWNMEADQAARVANTLTVAVNKTKAEIATMANAIQYAGSAAADMGVSFEEFVSIASSVTNAGMKARAVVGTGFRAVLTELTTPTEKLQKVFKKLGVSMSDIDIEGRGVTNVLKTLREAGLGAAEAFEGFDRRAASFYLAASSQLDTVNDLREAFLKEGAVMRANEVQMNTLSSQMTRFNNIMKSTTKEAVEPFIAVITKLLKLVNDLLGNGVARLITEFAAVTIAFRGSITLIGYLTAGFVKFVAIMKSVTAAMKISSLAALGFGGALKTIAVGLAGWPIALVVGSIYALVKMFGKAKESLEDIQGRIDEQTQRMSSLSEAYDELIAKQSLYEEDNNALILRVNELNKQFKLQGSALIDLASDYDEVIRKMKELEFQSNKDKANSASQKAKQLLPTNQATLWDKIRYGLTGGRPEDSWIRRYGRRNMLSVESTEYFWKIVNASDEQLSEAKIALSQMVEADREHFQKVYNSAIEYTQLLKDIQSSAATEQLRDSVIKATTEADVMSNTALKAYKQNVSNWLSSSGGVFSIDKLYGEESTAIKILEAQLETINKEIDIVAEQVKSGKLNADSPAVTSLQKSKINIEKAIGEITLESSEEIGKILKGDLKYAEQAVKQVTKSIRAGFYDRETLLQMAKDAKEGVLKAVNEDLKKRIKDIKYEEGSDLYNKELKKLQFDADTTIAQHVSDLDKAVFDLLHNLEQVSQTFKAARVRMAEIKNDLKDRDYNKNIESNILSEASEFLPETVSSYISGFAKNKKDKSVYDKLESYLFQHKRAMSSYEDEKAKNDLVLEALNNSKKKLETDLDIAKTEGEYVEIKKKIAEIDKQIATGDQLKLDLERAITEELRTQEALVAAISVKNEREEVRSGVSGSFGVGVYDAVKKMGADNKEFTSFKYALENIGTTTFDTFTQGFADMVVSFRENSKSFGEALKDFTKNTLLTISDYLAQLATKAVIYQGLNAAFGGLLGSSNSNFKGVTNPNEYGPFLQRATGGYVTGGVPNRDSVYAKLMPGEFVLKKSSADYLGSNFLHALNNNAAETMNSITPAVGVIDGKEQSSSVVNVWVVQDEKEAGMGPNDVIATIAKDIRTGGTTKTLIKSVIAGRK